MTESLSIKRKEREAAGECSVRPYVKSYISPDNVSCLPSYLLTYVLGNGMLKAYKKESGDYHYNYRLDSERISFILPVEAQIMWD